MTRLPFWATLGDAYRIVFRPLRNFGELGMPWVVLLCFASWAISHFGAGYGVWLTIGYWFAWEAVAIVFAARWYRFLLSWDRPPPAPFGISLLRYAGAEAVLIAATYALERIASAGLFEPADEGAAFYVALAVWVATSFPIGRLMLVLPALAFGDLSRGLGESWRATLGNTLRLGFGLLLSSLPLTAATLLLGQVVAPYLMTQGAWLTSYAAFVAASLLFLLEVAVVVSFVTLAYRHFYGGAFTPAERQELLASFD